MAPPRLKWLQAIANNAAPPPQDPLLDPQTEAAAQRSNAESLDAESKSQIRQDGSVSVLTALTDRVEAPVVAEAHHNGPKTAREAGWLGTSMQNGGEYSTYILHLYTAKDFVGKSTVSVQLCLKIPFLRKQTSPQPKSEDWEDCSGYAGSNTWILTARQLPN